jgi:folate-binding protein YgfZ
VAERFLLTQAASSLPAPLASLRVVSSDAWWWSEVAAGIPTVFLATQEKFVPQMINFEVLGGVNFKKGCYPGQEIVARSQYLGKLKRRMQVAHAKVEDPPAPGSDVFQSAQEQPVGTVVMAAHAPGGGVDLLFEAPLDRIGTGTLHIGSASGAELHIRPLPYELFDPTA